MMDPNHFGMLLRNYHAYAAQGKTPPSQCVWAFEQTVKGQNRTKYLAEQRYKPPIDPPKTTFDNPFKPKTPLDVFNK